jgi:hypothetical protein
LKLEENCYLVEKSKNIKIGDCFLGKTVVEIENYDENYVKIKLVSNNFII